MAKKDKSGHQPPGQMKPVDATRTLPDGTFENRTFANKSEWKSRDKSEGWIALDDDDDDDAEEPEDGVTE